MNIEEFNDAFQHQKIQIHVHNIAEWDACIDALVDLGYCYVWDRDYWRRDLCEYILNHGKYYDGRRLGLNHDAKPLWGKPIEYHDFLNILNSHDKREPIVAANTAEIMALIGM